MSDIDNARRAEKSGLVTLTQSALDKQQARVEKIDERILALRGKLADSASAREAAIAGKAPDAQEAYARAYVNSELAKGSKVDPVILRAKGMEEYVKTNRSYQPSFAATEQRSLSAADEARIKREDQDRKDRDLAEVQGGKTLTGAGMLPLIKAQTLDTNNAAENKKDGGNRPTDNVANVRAKATADALARIRAGRGDSKPAAPQSTAVGAPSYASIKGAPAGGKIGAQTSKGWEILGPKGVLVGYAQ
jgi:hypothetical protein